MTILITAIFRLFVLLTVLFVAFWQGTCSGSTDNSIKNANITTTSANTAAPVAEKTSSGMKLFVPSFFNSGDYTSDGNGKWNKLIALLNAGDVMIINPDSGPAGAPEDGFKKAFAEATGKGIIVLGYVHTRKDKTHKRVEKEIYDDIDKYKVFYGIVNIFFDQFTEEDTGHQQTVEFYTRLCDYVRNDGGISTLNPGMMVNEDYAKITGNIKIVVFESPNKEYQTYDMAHWEWSLKPEYHDKIVHLILGTDPKDWKAVVAKARSANAGYVYVTELIEPGVWDNLASYWPEEIVEVRK